MQNLHLTFDGHYIRQSKVKTSQNFAAFSEYMNFNKIIIYLKNNLFSCGQTKSALEQLCLVKTIIAIIWKFFLFKFLAMTLALGSVLWSIVANEMTPEDIMNDNFGK